MRSAILGRKIGMTSLFTERGEQVPCTVLEAGPCPVVDVRTPEKDGYKAVQIGFGDIKEKNLPKPLLGQYKKAGVVPKRHLKEFRDPDREYAVGQSITVSDFEVGDLIHVSGKSKGRGFQGVMKRYNFSGVGMQTHGQKNRERHPGSIGQSSYPSKVMKGMKMAGRMGGKRVTVRNLQVVGIVADRNLLLVRGPVPGSSNSLLEIIKQ